MAKISFFDKRLGKKLSEITSVVFAALSGLLIFVEIPTEWKLPAGGACLAFLALAYLTIWYQSNNLNAINISVGGE